ncbi:HAD-IIIC family phosphatase [Tunturiibacter gelidiferens]|uniref:HAD-IIIC family phosphatase n=1 Tax=Tunturiibacter gelidiferens TaxID=3069689 RepID=UPI003D9ABB7E
MPHDLGLRLLRCGSSCSPSRTCKLARRSNVFGISSSRILGLLRSIFARPGSLVLPLFRAPRKVLCTDLDNTLWGGVLGEEGPEGIATGSAFPGNCYLEYQRYLKQLSARGILLAIVSKNNDADVREAFQIRAADLGLTLDNFVATKISWNEKATSIRELAEELSLGLDSFVFVDDNPVECEAIRQQLPEVAVIAAPIDEPWKLLELLSSQPFFDAAVITDDDVNRLNEYKAQAQRAELASTAGNRDEFLASLEIVCTFLSALDAPSHVRFSSWPRQTSSISPRDATQPQR